MIVFQAKYFTPDGKYHAVEFDTADEAIAVIEAKGEGSVIQFNKTISPDYSEGDAECWRYQYSSCAMWTYQTMNDKLAWRAHSIFDGYGAAYAEERPN